MDHPDEPERLTTEQVAWRLGVKPETVYAYVSRGVLHSVRGSDGRGSLFDAAEVDRLVAGGKRGRRTGGQGPVIRTALTLISGGRLSYRGRDATDLARTHTFETVAHWLWTERFDPEVRFAGAADVVGLARTAIAALPPGVLSVDRLRLIAGVAASVDPLRFTTEADAVAATGANLLGVLVDALPLVGIEPRDDPAGLRLADRLWPRLTAEPAHPAGLAALNGALVLLADHDLAASTLAARVAASTRAHPYAVVAAGLSASEGPLHGLAAGYAYRLLADAMTTGDPIGVYSEALRRQGHVTGFAGRPHRFYPDGDPRAAALLDLITPVPAVDGARAAIDGLLEAARRRSPQLPTVDFALAALAHTCRMSADAGEAIFAIARTAGWLAHAMEEYREPGLRFRFVGTYSGHPPPTADR
ncbi:citrate synthase [Plantactinospora sp. GCM10030261]|uniref:citrate synthase n=1 Tax=Plantactinospora sp. GCM10030261 TaxID=3273420 RepID=UPI00361CFF49